jgi:type IV secretory pathway TraG/TraD family ATPase VirD4
VLRPTWHPAATAGTAGVGFIFYTQVEFSLSPIVDDYDGELTAAIYGAVVGKA